MIVQVVRSVNTLNDGRPPPPLRVDGVLAHNSGVQSPVRPKLDTSQRILVQLLKAQDRSEAEVIADIANACNCSRELVYQWKKGNRRITDSKLKQLAAFFGVSESYMKYGTPPLDADRLSEVAAGAIEALVAAGVIETGVSPEQIGNFIAQVFADHEVDGEIDREQIRRYIRMIAPWAAASGRPTQ